MIREKEFGVFKVQRCHNFSKKDARVMNLVMHDVSNDKTII
jgi:hypothetical protein